MNKIALLGAAIIGLSALSAPAHAQTMDHSAHSAHSAHQPATTAHDMTDVSGAEAALVSYREALTSRDADAMTALFAEKSAIFENGKDEGNFAHYMEHHLGPELDAITSFTFSEPTVAVTRMGHMAYGQETYNYRIELNDGRVVEREGVASSVLKHDANGWKIVQYHSSSRAPRKP